MNQKVKSLYNNLNLKSIPKTILDYFYKAGNAKDFFGSKPLNAQFNFEKKDVNFFYDYGEKRHILKLIEDKKLLDKDNNLLNVDDFYDIYLLEYGKGFQNGYYEFKNRLKPENPLFTIDNEQTIHKVFSKVLSNGSFKKVGGFTISLIPHKKMTELDKRYKTKDLYWLKKESYLKSGYDGGEFYKAWEIILHNPTLFEDVFIKHFEDAEIKKPLLENTDIKHLKEFDYIKIGVLIAQGKLTKMKKGYEYKDNTYDKMELEKELKKDLNIKSIRQYIEGTFGVDAETTYKNDLRRNSTKIKKIVEYCVFYKKSITEQYQKLFDELG